MRAAAKAGVIAIAIAFPRALFAQAPVLGDEGPAPPTEQPAKKPKKSGLPDLKPSCEQAEKFGGTDVERSAFCYYQDGKYASTRTLADKALRDNPWSTRGHYLMGAAQHKGEGNLPKAVFHLERSEELLMKRHGKSAPDEAGEFILYHLVLQELVHTHGEMDHRLEKIRYVDALQERLGEDYSPLKAWPLMKLKRFDEARLVAKLSIASEEIWHRDVGLTALCAVESEQRRRQEAYDACIDAARPVMKSRHDGAVELSNAGAAAEEMFKFDEAERYYTMAARRPAQGSVNPWGRLARLYLRQGRFAEAVSAWREMRRYRANRPSDYLNQQDQAESAQIGVSILLVAGKSKEADPIATRTVSNPDRQGTSSAASEQNEAGAAIATRVVKLDLARRFEEEASAAPLKEALQLRLRAATLRFDAWIVGRMASEMLASRERLVTSLRPECPGSIEAPAWMDAEVIHLVGPGVALAAIAEARQEETLPEDLSEPVFQALEAEARLLTGHYREAGNRAKFALESLPESERLLRARVAAVGAQAALQLGEVTQALRLYRMVLATDPGLIRRLGHTLPVAIRPAENSALVARAVEMLEESPLFRSVEWGFALHVGSKAAVLRLSDGSELARVMINPGPKKDDEAAARHIANTIHSDLLVPNVDVTQADIRSLDGALGPGGRADERVNSILEEVMEDTPKTPE